MFATCDNHHSYNCFVLAIVFLLLLPALHNSAEAETIRPISTQNPNTLQAGSTFRDCPNCPALVAIPAGTFLMGTSQDDAERDIKHVPPKERKSRVPGITMGAEDYMAQEMPKHDVRIERPFALGVYPIMRGEYATFVNETGYNTNGDCIFHHDHRYQHVPGLNWRNPGFAQTDRDPVVCVNKSDMEAYLVWLNSHTHERPSNHTTGPYRLPSEAEWEYAARAGTQTAYWWGDSIGSNSAVCDACGNRWDNKQTAPVDLFQANPYGLYDMLGNVWEFTADCWHNNYTHAPLDGRAWMTAGCSQHVMRGGSWSTDPWGLRSASRSRTTPDNRADYIGFRVARSLF
jgi:formylglycine-generating enzyme required for sulfatase activity